MLARTKIMLPAPQMWTVIESEAVVNQIGGSL
jgi:hypothetical protein